MQVKNLSSSSSLNLVNLMQLSHISSLPVFESYRSDGIVAFQGLFHEQFFM